MHRATFMRWIEMCEGTLLWVITIVPFEACQGSKIDNKGSSFGTGRAPASYLCCHTHELKIELMFVLTASDYNSAVDLNSCRPCTLGTCPISFGGEHIMFFPFYSPTITLQLSLRVNNLKSRFHI